MSEPRDDHGTPVGGLPPEVDPPDGLEARLVGEMRRRGLVGRRRAPSWVPFAAAMLGMVAGWLAHGGFASQQVAPSRSGGLYLLLLSNDPPGEPSTAERVRLYSAWARELAAEGRLESAKKLTDEGVVVAAASAPPRPLEPSPDRLSGFYLLRADSLDEAVALALESPHARLGGVVTVRPIDPV